MSSEQSERAANKKHFSKNQYLICLNHENRNQIFNPDEKSQLATEVMTRDSKSRFLDMDILELKLDSSIVRMQDNPDEFYLTLSVSAVVLEKVE